MNQKIESISTDEGKNDLNIILIDEMCPSPDDHTYAQVNTTGGLEHDWSDLKCNQENVFLLVAFNPCSTKYGSGIAQKFKIKIPGNAKDSHSKHEQLHKIYRSAPSIAKFADYVRNLMPDFNTDYGVDLLDCDYSSKAKEAKLPTAMEGLSQPLIVLYDSTDSSFPPANTIVDYLVTKYNVEKYSTTVIRSKEKWSTINCPKGHCTVEPKNLQGIENECIIYVVSTIEMSTSPLDVLTRARNGLIIVINCDFNVVDGLFSWWKILIEGIVNQSTSSNTEDRIAKIVLAKKSSDKSDVHLDENLKEIQKLLKKRNFNVPDEQKQATSSTNFIIPTLD